MLLQIGSDWIGVEWCGVPAADGSCGEFRFVMAELVRVPGGWSNGWLAWLVGILDTGCRVIGLRLRVDYVYILCVCVFRMSMCGAPMAIMAIAVDALTATFQAISCGCMLHRIVSCDNIHESLP